MQEFDARLRALKSSQTQLELFFSKNQDRIGEIANILEAARRKISSLSSEGANQENLSKRIAKLHRAQKDLDVYMKEMLDFTHGTSRLVQSAERNINKAGEHLGRLEES